jgi:hypothetical protein
VPMAVAGRGPEPQLMASRIPAKPERGAHQQLLPIEVVDQDWGLPPWGPRPTDRRPL